MKKPYTAPRLISYGHVKDIVQGSIGPMTGDGSGTTKPCWVAEALYGTRDPRTLLLRSWLTGVYERREPFWQLVALYVRYGQTTAALIRAGLLPGRLFRPLFDSLCRQAFDRTAGSVKAASARS